MIISNDTDNAFKNLSLFLVKNINKNRYTRKLSQRKQEKFHKIPKLTLYEKGKIESFLPKVRNKKNLSMLPLLFNTVLKVLYRVIGTEKEIKDTHIGKLKVKQNLFTVDIIPYIEINQSPRKLIEIMNHFIKFIS